jgi:hypothetical protein
MDEYLFFQDNMEEFLVTGQTTNPTAVAEHAVKQFDFIMGSSSME